LQPIRGFLQPRVNKLMLGWIVLALVGTGAFVLLALPYIRMPDVSNTLWHELARGVAPGDEGAHQLDDPYFILGTNESSSRAVASIRERLMSEGWRVYEAPDPLGGVSFYRTDDPNRMLALSSFPDKTLHDVEDYSVDTDRLREWQRQYAHIYVLEMFFP